MREQTEELARTLDLSVIEPGVTRGVRNGRTVEVVLGLSASFGRNARARTSCRVYLEPPFAIPFAVGVPPRQTAGTTARWEDVGIGGPSPESLALATSLAPIVRAHAGRLDGVLVIEVDRATTGVSLEGYVLDRERGSEERGPCEAFDGLLSLDVLGRCMISLAAGAGEITCSSTPSR